MYISIWYWYNAVSIHLIKNDLCASISEWGLPPVCYIAGLIHHCKYVKVLMFSKHKLLTTIVNRHLIECLFCLLFVIILLEPVWHSAFKSLVFAGKWRLRWKRAVSHTAPYFPSSALLLTRNHGAQVKSTAPYRGQGAIWDVTKESLWHSWPLIFLSALMALETQLWPLCFLWLWMGTIWANHSLADAPTALPTRMGRSQESWNMWNVTLWFCKMEIIVPFLKDLEIDRGWM